MQGDEQGGKLIKGFAEGSAGMGKRKRRPPHTFYQLLNNIDFTVIALFS